MMTSKIFVWANTSDWNDFIFGPIRGYTNIQPNSVI